MTPEEFTKLKFRQFEPITYSDTINHIATECMLLAIDFEQGLFRLAPIFESPYCDEKFWVRFEYCYKSLHVKR